MTTTLPWWQWLAIIGGWALAVGGLALLLWALFWDRSRGRKRCPKCWYDMAGVPGLVCPECGRKVTDARSLLRTRRRYDRAGVGLALLSLAWVTGSLPQVQLSGWTGFIPTSALVLGFRVLERPTRPEQQMWDSGGSLPLAKHLFMDLRRNRLDKGRVAPWQRRIMWSRMLAGDSDDPAQLEHFWDQYEAYVQVMQNDSAATESQRYRLLNWTVPVTFHVRNKWPAGVPIVVTIRPLTGWEDTIRGRVLRVCATQRDSVPVAVPAMGPKWWRDATHGAAWEHHQCVVPAHGVDEPVEVDVEVLDFTESSWNAAIPQWKCRWSKRIRLPVHIVEATAAQLVPSRQRYRTETGSLA